MDPLRERRELRLVLGTMPRSRQQTNALFEADAEILRLGPREYLVTSTDSLGEEISEKLYEDPALWGWMTVMSSVSDLAATGARGLGLLVSTQWAFGTREAVKKKFFVGVRDALKAARLPLLGGDSGSAVDHVFTGVVLGRSRTAPLTRKGAKPGDAVILLGPPRLGAGPALALRYLGEHPKSWFPEKLFRPRPDPAAAERWRDVASCAIDTSDGLAVSLAILADLNRVGFELEWDENLLLPEALRFCRRAKLPPALLWTSDHGDFQTLLCVPEKALRKIPKASYSRLGTVTGQRGQAWMSFGDKRWSLPLQDVLNGGRDLDSIRRLTKRLTTYFHGLS